MKKFIGISVFVLALFASLSASATYAAGNAGYGQYGQYGSPAQQQSILIDKTIATGETTKGGQQTFVDNLSLSDPKFKPGDEITFKLKVKNTVDSLTSNVKVTDVLPGSLDLVSGGSLKSDGSVVIDAGDFKPNEEKEFTVKTRVKSVDRLPADRGVFCELNKARVQTDQASDEDTAQFCIEKQVVGVKQVPQAGPEAGLLLFGGELAALTAGIYLKKKSK